MEENKKNKIPNVPNLRFGEFEKQWSNSKLACFAKKKRERNIGNTITNVICNSAQFGLIPQRIFFDKDIANDANTDKYWVIEEDDFVYNPRISNLAPYGPVNRYSFSEKGVVSPLYLVFTVSGMYKPFLLYRFQSPCWYRFMYLNGDSGARSDRVSIRDDIFLSQPVFYPEIDEQKKIATFLSLIDERIKAQNKIIEKHESLIKQIRYTIGLNYSMAPKTSLSNLCSIKTGKKDANASSRNGKYPFFTCGKETLLIDTYSFEGKALLVSGNGEIGQVKYYDGKFDAYQRTYVLQNFLVNPKYIKIWLETLLPKVIEKEKNVGAMPYIVVSTLADIKIPRFDTKYENTLLCLFQAIENKLKAGRLILELYRKQKEFLLTNLFI